MKLNIITNEEIFKEKLQLLKNHFNDKIRMGVLSPLYEDAYKPLKNTYDVVFNNEVLYGIQEKMATFWPLKDSYEEGGTFLNSELGQLYQEVIYYFSYHYNVPKNQKGGYNIAAEGD